MPRERLIVLLPVEKVWIGDRAVLKVWLALVQHDELLGMRIGKRIEQDTVDHRKERSVRADAERERQDGDRREAGAFAQRANGESNILRQFVKPSPAPLIPRDVLDQRHIAEFPPRCCSGLLQPKRRDLPDRARTSLDALRFLVRALVAFRRRDSLVFSSNHPRVVNRNRYS